MTSAKKLFAARRVQEFCTDCLRKAGLSPESSAIVAESLVLAEVRGVYSHGVVRLENYLNRVEAGVMKLQAPIVAEMDREAVALLNANNTFGQIAGQRAMTLAIEKAKRYGTGCVAVKNSNHFGIAAYYAMMALAEGMVGCVFTNASPAMAVYGTTAPLIGTNPIAITVPAGERLPIVLDMSTSVVARGKIRYAAITGQEIPPGWARDKDGKPTRNAKAALQGTLEPVGGVKGSALSLIIDLLCGVLTDTVLTGGVKNITDTSGPARTGHVFAALNVARFIDLERFKRNVDAVIDHIKSLPPVEGGQIFMPGEIEYLATEKRMKEGIPLDEEIIRTMDGIAARYGAAPLSAE